MDGIIISFMNRSVIPGMTILAGILVAILPQRTLAQLAPCTMLSHPIPTLAQEIREMNTGQSVSSIVLGDLRIKGEVHDRDAVRRRVLKKLEKCSFDSEGELLSYTKENGIREDFQDRGFYEVNVDAEAQKLDIKNQQQRMAVVATINEGSRYRVGEIRLESIGQAFELREGYLRGLLPLHKGDILNPGKIREGIRRIQVTYANYGFIDLTIEPRIDIDHTTDTASLVLKVFQGERYYIEEVEVFGLPPDSEASLKRLVTPGDLYNQATIDHRIQEVRSRLTRGRRPSKVLQIVRDRQKGTVKVIFDFRDSPAPAN